MNDRYLFKAKRTDNGEWVKGYYRYIQCLDEHHILPINPTVEHEAEYRDVWVVDSEAYTVEVV